MAELRRWVPLASVLPVVDGIIRHVRSRYVFVGGNGEPYLSRKDRLRISALTIRAAKLAGLQDVSFHTLRHTAASWLVQAGVPLYEVQGILGHTSPTMTQRYAHLAPDYLRRSEAVLASALGIGKEGGCNVRSVNS